MTRWSYVEVIVMTFSTPRAARVSGWALPRPGGYAMDPVATIVPWPSMSRGTDATVPRPPGLVSVTEAPRSSSGFTWPERVRPTRSS